METANERFLRVTKVETEDHALHNCILATFRRNKLYLNGWNNTSPSHKQELRLSLKAELQRLAQQYIDGDVSEIGHEANIISLSDELSKKHGAILLNSRFNIGASQKALNLYLKFLWCLGRLSAEPIHCPVDNIILGKASVYGAWTRLDDIETYRIWISEIRKVTDLQSLSAWELEAWNNSLPPDVMEKP